MKSVLIISDDQELAANLKAALWSNRFSLRILRGNELVVEDLNQTKPDLILIDFLLNDANGGSLCHEIRGYHGLHHIPVILLSEYPDIERFTAKFGCNAIIRKPILAHELINTLTMMLQRPGISQQSFSKAS